MADNKQPGSLVHCETKGEDFRMAMEKETESLITLAKPLQEIRDVLKPYNIDATTEIDTIQDKMSKMAKYSLNTLIHEFETFKSGVEKITSGLPLNIVLGNIDLISTLSALVPIAQVIVPLVCNLASKLFISQCRGEADMCKFVGDVLRETLNEYKDEELESKSEGIIEEFKFIDKYLRSHIKSVNSLDQPVDKADIAAVVGKVPDRLGIEILVTLSRQIKHLTNQNNSHKCMPLEKMRNLVEKILKYIDMYCYISILRELMFWTLYTFLIDSKASQMHIDATLSQIQEQELLPQRHFDFLMCPNPCSGIVMAFLDPEKYQLPCIFLQKRHVIQDTAITEEALSLRCLYFPNFYIAKEQWNVAMKMYVRKTLTAVKSTSKEMKSFCLKRLDNGYHIIRHDENMSTCVILDENGYAYSSSYELKEDEEPGFEGQWKVIRVHLREIDIKNSHPKKQSDEETGPEDDCCNNTKGFCETKHHAYILCTRKWPGKYIYMANTAIGSIYSRYGNPGRKGLWFFDKA